jgi:hypothetical protein
LNAVDKAMRLLIFLHGTVIMHSGAVGRARSERVAQVRAWHPTVGDYAAYVPVGDAVAKLQRWRDSDARIDYLSSHREPEDVAKDVFVLRAYAFPMGRVLARQPGESYGELVSREVPDVLIEDDCESIGAGQISYPQIRPDVRARIKSIIVPEFGGIDHLPDLPQDLLTFQPSA